MKIIENDIINLSRKKLIKRTLEVFASDSNFKWIGEPGLYNYGDFMRAISDCSNGSDKPYKKLYNFLIGN